MTDYVFGHHDVAMLVADEVAGCGKRTAVVTWQNAVQVGGISDIKRTAFVAEVKRLTMNSIGTNGALGRAGQHI